MRFNPGWAMTIFVALFLPVTLGLGSWQLNRAAEKNQIIAAYERDQVTAVQEWLGLDRPAPGTRLRLCVVAAQEHWFLDNRTHAGQVGYEVFVPAEHCSTATPVLLRLGFIAASGPRSQLPALSANRWVGEHWIDAEVRPRPPEPMLTAAAEAMGLQRWRLQSLERIPEGSHIEPSTLLVQVKSPQDWQLLDAWQPVTMAPERHLGYAIQWFGLAMVLVVGFLIWGVHRAADLQRGKHEE